MQTKKVVKPKSNTKPAVTELGSATLAPFGSNMLPPGFRVETAKLREQVARSIRTGIDLATDLTPGGWTPSQNLGLQDADAAFVAAYLAYGKAKEASKESQLTFDALVEDTLVFREQVVAALRIATGGTENPFKDDRLHLGTSRKPRKLVMWLEEVIVQVEKHQAALQKRFGTDPVALIKEHAAQLLAGIAARNAARTLLPAAYKAQQDARVKLAAGLNEQRLAAKMAFPKDKAKLARFVPIWETKKAKSAKVTPTSGETPPPASAATGPQTPAVPASSAAEPSSPAAPSTPAVPAAPAVPELPVAAAAAAAVRPVEAAPAKPD